MKVTTVISEGFSGVDDDYEPSEGMMGVGSGGSNIHGDGDGISSDLAEG